jgi:asparagine synthase (glutamine-hydrolysing)
MLAGIYKLPPATCLVWEAGSSRLVRYWRLPEPRPAPRSAQAAAPELRERLRRAVTSHLVSDVPLGAALSGGLDSSGIVVLMAEVAGGPVETFTVGHGPDDPDLAAARLVAEHCRTHHHEIVVSGESVADALPEVVWRLEEPLGHMETVQMLANYREAARSVRVLLIGEGADECFGGYDRYRLLLPSFPAPLAVQKDLYERVYMDADCPPRTAAARLAAGCLWGSPPISPLADPRPCPPPPLVEVKRRAGALERALHYDRQALLPHLYLKRADALGMAHSLELRCPYLDRQVVEFAATLPAPLLIRGGVEKFALRQALAPLLPEAVASRRKHPLQMRVDAGLVGTLDYLCDLLLSPADVRERGFFCPDRVASIRAARPSRLAPVWAHKFWAWRIWAMLLCELWARLFLDRPAGSPAPASVRELV